MSTQPTPAAGARGSAEVERAEPGNWRSACTRALDEHLSFEGLFAAPGGDGSVELRALFSSSHGERIVACQIADGAADSLVEAIPAAAWDEREIHDLHGVHFAGHEPMRPLLDHRATLDPWTVRVTGPGTHEVAVGPVHAGIIESGHFRLHVVGERILHLDVRLFYKRRGLEAAAAGRSLGDAIAYVQRACAACAVTNTVAYAQACEAALGLDPDGELRRARTLLLELERVYNHLHDISAICAGVGFAAGTMAYADLKERAQRLNDHLTGHRFLFAATDLGASHLTIAAADIAHARDELRAIHEEHSTLWRQLQFAGSLQDRLTGIGVLTHDDAARLGAVGPAARASGIRHDARADSPRLWYDEFEPVSIPSPAGDVASRTTQRVLELDQSLSLLDTLLARPITPGHTSPVTDGARIGIGRVESPRGTTVCLIERDGDTLRRLHLRTGSYANWPVLGHVVPGNLLPEFPLINKSFELCYACVDR